MAETCVALNFPLAVTQTSTILSFQELIYELNTTGNDQQTLLRLVVLLPHRLYCILGQCLLTVESPSVSLAFSHATLYHKLHIKPHHRSPACCTTRSLCLLLPHVCLFPSVSPSSSMYPSLHYCTTYAVPNRRYNTKASMVRTAPESAALCGPASCRGLTPT